MANFLHRIGEAVADWRSDSIPDHLPVRNHLSHDRICRPSRGYRALRILDRALGGLHLLLRIHGGFLVEIIWGIFFIIIMSAVHSFCLLYLALMAGY